MDNMRERERERERELHFSDMTLDPRLSAQMKALYQC